MQSKHNQNQDALDVAKKAKQIWCSILIFPTNLVIMIMTMIKIGLLHVFPCSLFCLRYQVVLPKTKIFQQN